MLVISAFPLLSLTTCVVIGTVEVLSSGAGTLEWCDGLHDSVISAFG